MLQSLHVENYALIAGIDMTFDPGFNVITGETGAGKSILLGALNLILGARADNTVLYHKQKKCIIEATFEVNTLDMGDFFARNDLDYDTSVILRRELLPGGKSRAFINDTPVTLPVMRELGSALIDIHSQHQTLNLMDNRYQLGLVDSMMEHPEVLSGYQEAYKQYASCKRRLEQLTEQDAKNRKEADYDRFVLNELEEAHLVVGEQEQLEANLQVLQNTEEIKKALTTIAEIYNGSDYSEGVIGALTTSKSELTRIANYHKDFAEQQQRVESVVIELRDIADELEHLNTKFQYSEEEQSAIEERLDMIYRLQKKHGVASVEELIGIQRVLQEKLQSMMDMDDEIRRTMGEVDAAYKQLQQWAPRLTEQRKRAASVLQAALLPLLAELGMKEARVQISFSAVDFTPKGCDEVLFLFNANRGGDMQELAKVSSGGELSRLMLAVKAIVSEHRALPTIIFDEIDSGVSGTVAGRVSGMMQRMAQRTQVVAITHLPQMASRAMRHFKVYKDIDADSNRTTSHIRVLSETERVVEVATMLSADPPTAAALDTAREMIGRDTTEEA